jgi:DNA-binding NarL/FixJ family response regulator
MHFHVISDNFNTLSSLYVAIKEVFPNWSIYCCSTSNALDQDDGRRPDIIVVDVAGTSTHELLRRLKQCDNNGPLALLLTDEHCAGVADSLPNTPNQRHVQRANIHDELIFIRKSMSRGALAEKVCTEDRPGSEPVVLTPRQISIVQLLEDGYSNKKIADSLGLSYGTVKNYIHDLTRRFAVHSRLQIVTQIRIRGYICTN